jgi:hypothetical protein
MTLIKSISGIRGTIGESRDNLTPLDAVKFASYGTLFKIKIPQFFGMRS